MRADPASADWLALGRTLLKYAVLHNDADNAHEGYNTLVRWTRRPATTPGSDESFDAHLGQRVLEIGAGIGTITRRDRPRARAGDRAGGGRLLRRAPHGTSSADCRRCRALHCPTSSATDWAALRRERLDTVLLCNVLEHIEDDAAAVRRFRSVLPEAGGW